MPWFRLWDSALDSVKVQSLSGELFRTWVNLLLAATRQKEGGTLPPVRTLAFWLRLDTPTLDQHLADLVAEGLVERDPSGVLRVHDWIEWQPTSDLSTERVNRFRNARKQEPETERNGSETATKRFTETKAKRRRNDPETASKRPSRAPDRSETDTDTDQTQSLSSLRSKDGENRVDVRSVASTTHTVPHPKALAPSLASASGDGRPDAIGVFSHSVGKTKTGKEA